MKKQEKPLKQYSALQYYLLLRQLKVECSKEYANLEDLQKQLKELLEKPSNYVHVLVNDALKKRYHKVRNASIIVSLIGVASMILNGTLNSTPSYTILSSLTTALFSGSLTLTFLSDRRLKHLKNNIDDLDPQSKTQVTILNNQIKRSKEKISKLINKVIETQNSEVIFYNADGTEMDYGDAAFYLYNLDDIIARSPAEPLEHFFGIHFAIPHQDENINKIANGESIRLPNGQTISAQNPAPLDLFDEEETDFDLF